MPTTVTKTVKSSGGDYTSLSAWEAGQQADIVTADQIQQAECYTMTDTAQCVINGWTTDATRYIRIYTPASERHAGVWTTGKYNLDDAGDWEGQLGIYEDYARLEGLQIRNTGANNPYVVAILASAGEVRISTCILRGGSDGINADGVGAGTLKAWDNLIYDGSGTGVRRFRAAADGTVILYNNTICDTSGNQIYIQNCTTLKIKNNATQGVISANYSLLGVTTQTSATNLSEDATSPETGLRNKVISFVDETGDNFHLASGDTVAKDAGTDLSADADLAFSDDIDGETRSGSWDIGADEVIAAAAAGGFANYQCLLGVT